MQVTLPAVKIIAVPAFHVPLLIVAKVYKNHFSNWERKLAKLEKPLLSHTTTNLSVLACLDVNHINDNPGYFTCDCVDSNDPCLAEGGCVVEERCPESDGQTTGIHV